MNLTIHGGGEAGGFAYTFYLSAPNALVQGCNIYDVSGIGIQIYNGYGQAIPGVVVRNTRIHRILRSHDTRYSGILVANGATGTKIYNNVIHDIGAAGAVGAGIHMFAGVNVEVYNNTVSGGSVEGIAIEPYSSGIIVRNNISYNSGSGDYRNSGSGTSASNNLFGADPQFLNTADKDFRLKPGSPAVDAGATIALVGNDMAGVKRPSGSAYDIGAYELGSSQAAAPAQVAPSPPTGLRVVN